jgi:D-glycero-alpha-D-manno-heptose-7-phosphate kinase
MMPSKKQLAMESIHIEQDILRETVGSQDQVSASHGGLNVITFLTTGEVDVRPVTLSRARLAELQSHLMLLYTGIRRTASDVAKTYVENIDTKQDYLGRMHEMVGEGLSVLQGNSCVCRFGELLHEGWMLKRCLSPKVSSKEVDDLYERARAAGAIGGKITGAGGGGFLLLFVPPSAQVRVREALGELIHVPFAFEFNGSQIIFYDPQPADYADLDRDRTRRAVATFRELDS